MVCFSFSDFFSPEAINIYLGIEAKELKWKSFEKDDSPQKTLLIDSRA